MFTPEVEIYGCQGREGASGREGSSVNLDPHTVLFQKLPTRPKSLSATGDNEVVRLPLSEEAKDAFHCQQPANTVPPDRAFNVVAHGSLGGLWQRKIARRATTTQTDCSPFAEVLCRLLSLRCFQNAFKPLDL